MIATSCRGNHNFIGALAFAIVLLVLGAGVAKAAEPEKYGVESISAQLSTTQAGEHADFTTTLELKTDPSEPIAGGVHPPYARTKNLFVTVPPGLLGNPENFPKCTIVQFGNSAEDSECPFASQVGVINVTVYELGTFTDPVYLMEPPGGDVVARIGFYAGPYPTILDIRLRPDEGYALEAGLEGANALARLVRSKVTLWGLPAAKEHDQFRVTPAEAFKKELPPGGGRSVSPLVPFMTNPTRCGISREIKVRTDSYMLPGQFATASTFLPPITGCGKLTFSPKFSLNPTTSRADSPSGMNAELSLSQEGLLKPNILATPHLNRTVVTLPQGMTLNPASASGLDACTEAQMGLISESPIRFNAVPPACPPGSKVGTAEIKTPVLPEPLQGSLYLARQFDNPFNSLLAGYLVAQGQGITVKLAGRFEVNPANGQITAIFDENPEQPFENLKLHFKEGDNGVLTTPNACGVYSIASWLTPWSASNEATDTVPLSSSFVINQGPNGAGCPSGSFGPDLTAGTTDPTAGAYSPFVMRLTRSDGTSRIAGLEVTLPLGLTGKLAGIPYCPESAIQAAAALSQPGQGAVELASPSCPAASRLGTVTAGAGTGPNPFFVNTGRVYLAGPYKGAPLSLAIITPAVAGPFDLGDVVVRTALHVDPNTARLTAVSDPLPTMLAGIPLDLRDVRVNIDRSGFTLNPTSCEPKAFSGFAVAANGARAPISERFQAASCASLGFKPKLRLSLLGKMKRTGHPALRATLTPRPGDANIGRTSVTLPKMLFIDNAHIGNPCTRPQFAEQKCPRISVLGTAKAFTPLLDEPLTGKVYFRSNGGERELPDVVLDLRGQIHIVLVGAVDAVPLKDGESSRLRTTFGVVPDAPVSKFNLNLFGGKRGLLVNSENICAAPRRVKVDMTAQNGRKHNFNQLIKTSCGKRKR